MQHPKGFTLVEVLISIFVLSVMSIAALSSFQQMIRAKEVQKSHQIVLTTLSFAYTTMLNDVSQQIVLDAMPMTWNEREIIFSRAWQGGEKERNVADIRYTWTNDSVTREVTLGEDTTSQVLLKKVRAVQWEWLGKETWHDISVPLPADQTLRALKLTFFDPVAGEVSWIFMHP